MRRHAPILLACALAGGCVSGDRGGVEGGESGGMATLENALRERIAAGPGGEVGLSLIDLDTGGRIDIGADVEMHAASTMKVPVLYELFRQAEAGVVALDDSIPITNEFRSLVGDTLYSLSPADDSDSTLYDRIGGRATMRELARLMIARSSNLATNLLIERVGTASVQASMAAIGAAGMRVLRGVEDGPAFRRGLNNTTTAAAFAAVLDAIARCEGLSAESCDGITGILLSQEFNEMIPAGLPPGTAVAHKTGWITGIRHDGGIVFPPDRPPYVLVVLTRGFEDTSAVSLAADLSRLAWETLTGNAGRSR